MREIILVILLGVSSFCKSQSVITGVVKDLETNKPIPFAAIGLINKAIGTLCDENGNYTFKVDLAAEKDSLLISSIGYKSGIFSIKDLQANKGIVLLKAESFRLETVNIDSKKIHYKTLGITNYSKNNCSGFVRNEENWKGSETAILIENKQKILVEDFKFYIIQNKYTDSLVFRLMFYKTNGYKVGETFLRKPIIFKVKQTKGEFILPLKEYTITTDGDFFVSLECLMDEMEITKFCYAGSYKVPSYVKGSHFTRWTRVRGGGSDFNVKVSYVKD